MFTIKKKIIFSNLGVVIAASALIAIPVIKMQTSSVIAAFAVSRPIIKPIQTVDVAVNGIASGMPI